MIEIIKFPSVTRYLGRHGYGNMVGLEVMTGEAGVYLTPINSRGVASSCEMQIPYSDIDAVIKLLRKAQAAKDHQ